MKLRHLQYKIPIVLLLFIGSIDLLELNYKLGQTRRQIWQALDRHADSAGPQFVETFSAMIEQHNQTGIIKLFDWVKDDMWTGEAYFCDQNGRIVYGSVEGLVGKMCVQVLPRELDRKFENLYDSYTQLESSKFKRMDLYPLFVEGSAEKREGTLLIFYNWHHLWKDDRRELIQEFIWFSISLLIGCLGLWFYFYRYFGRRMTLLNKFATQLGDGTYDGKIKIDGNDEISDLAATLLQMMEKLRKSMTETNTLYNAIEASADMVLITDPEGKITYINQVLVTTSGFTREELIGQRPTMLKSQDQDQVAYKDLWKTILEGNVWKGRLFNQKKRGGKYPISMTVAPVRDEKGKIINFISIQRDIEKELEIEQRLERAKEQAQKANRAKSEFIATMGHEIRNPLNAVVGMSEVLQECALTPEQSKIVNRLSSAAKVLTNLVDDILEVSKIEEGKITLEKIPLDLRALVREILETFNINATKKGLTLKGNIDGQLPQYFEGDATRIKQVLANLIGNAIKFTSQGSINLDVSFNHHHQRRGNLLFQVIDTGIGVAPDRREEIFKMYIQEKQSTTRQYGGTGLGLFIAKKLVQLMGGEIWVVPAATGGSCFSFTLILGPIDQATFVDSQWRPATSQHVFEHQKILLVDDRPDNLFVLSYFLKDFNCQIWTAPDGKVAYDLFLQNQFDQIYMDWEMPEMNGDRCISLIREREQLMGLPQTPIVVCTGHAMKEILDKIYRAGANDYLLKPVKKHIFLEKIALFQKSENIINL